MVPEPPIRRPVGGLKAPAVLAMGFRELGRTFREIKRFKVVLVYLGAYLLFNDGLQDRLWRSPAHSLPTH